MHESDCIIGIGARESFWFKLLSYLRICFDLALPSSDQRNELALSIGIAVDIALSCLDRAMARQQLNVAQPATRLMDEAGRPGNKGAPTGIERAPSSSEVMSRA